MNIIILSSFENVAKDFENQIHNKNLSIDEYNTFFEEFLDHNYVPVYNDKLGFVGYEKASFLK